MPLPRGHTNMLLLSSLPHMGSPGPLIAQHFASQGTPVHEAEPKENGEQPWWSWCDMQDFCTAQLDGKQGRDLLSFGPGFHATGPQSSRNRWNKVKRCIWRLVWEYHSGILCKKADHLDLSQLYKTLKAPTSAKFSVRFSDWHCTERGT